MKISDVKCFPLWGGGRNFFFVKVETDEGLYGLGEAGITWREEAVEGFVEALKPVVVGQDARRIEHLWQLMFRGGFFPAGRVGCAAISAIDMALWDLRGKALGVPVYDLLGGLVRERAVCYPHTGAPTPEEAAAKARQLVAEGWKFIRLSVPSRGDTFAPGTACRQAVLEFAAVRGAVGDDVEVCIDIHTRLDPPDAVQLCRALEPYRPYFLEDPLRSENPASYARLRQHVAAPIAAGEQFATKWEFRELIERELIDYARVDLCIVGGLTEAKKVAGWCETHHILLAPHNPLGPVSTAACLHLSLATPNFGVLELPRRPGTVLADVFPVQPEFADGHLLPPTRPGLGLDFNEEAAAEHPFQAGNAPQLRREDGSFTNW